MKIDREELEQAQRVVYETMNATPQFAWPILANEVGCEVWVKHENCTPTGAFKVRGGLVFADRLRRERQNVKGIASATTGNHGQSLAFAGRATGLPVTIVVPHGNSVEKNASIRSFGAELIEHGHDFDEARQQSVAIAKERGFEVVPPFHRDLVLGVATYAAEFFAAAGELDAVFVPIGMGSGINAMIGVRDLLGLRTEVIGVVSELADAYARSFEAGEVINTSSAATFADGVATRSPDPTSFANILSGASRVIRVDERNIAEAMRQYYRATHHLPCGAGALGLAALNGERENWKNKRVGLVMTSTNIDTAKAVVALSGDTPGVGSAVRAHH